MTTKNYARSVRAKLLNISKEENVFYQSILTRYFQERLLYRLSVSPYKERFILKGGALLYAHEHLKARPTLDIDFLGQQISRELDNIKETFRNLCDIECLEDGVVFEKDSSAPCLPNTVNMTMPSQPAWRFGETIKTSRVPKNWKRHALYGQPIRIWTRQTWQENVFQRSFQIAIAMVPRKHCTRT